MSYEIGMQIMNLEMTEQVGRTEYCDHSALVQHITGLDPGNSNPEEQKRHGRSFISGQIMIFYGMIMMALSHGRS